MSALNMAMRILRYTTMRQQEWIRNRKQGELKTDVLHTAGETSLHHYKLQRQYRLGCIYCMFFKAAWRRDATQQLSNHSGVLSHVFLRCSQFLAFFVRVNDLEFELQWTVVVGSESTGRQLRVKGGREGRRRGREKETRNGAKEEEGRE